MSVTLKDVAEKLGVTITTVHKALKKASAKNDAQKS